MHSVSVRVRTYECDAYGHVNNAVYLNYLEYARDHWILDSGLDYQALVASGQGVFVAEARLTFQSPALPGEELTITTAVAHAGAAWLTLAQTIRCGERPVLEGELKLVWVGAHGRPTRIPIEWKSRLITAT